MTSPPSSLGKCKVVLRSGTLDPLMAMPGVTVELGKVRTDSTSAGRAHVEGSADGCCC